MRGGIILRFSFLILFVVLVLSVLSVPAWRILTIGANDDDILFPEKRHQFPPNFVPDPGLAGKATVEGIDSDKDGVRDDLQRWIYARFPNDPKKRGALKQAVVAFQYQLQIDPKDYKQRREAERRQMKSLHCLGYRLGVMNKETKYLEAKVVNTKKRIQRYLEISKYYEGEFFSDDFDDDETTCEGDY